MAEVPKTDMPKTEGDGWPSFTEPTSLDAVELVEDRSLFMRRAAA